MFTVRHSRVNCLGLSNDDVAWSYLIRYDILCKHGEIDGGPVSLMCLMNRKLIALSKSADCQFEIITLTKTRHCVSPWIFYVSSCCRVFKRHLLITFLAVFLDSVQNVQTFTDKNVHRQTRTAYCRIQNTKNTQCYGLVHYLFYYRSFVSFTSHWNYLEISYQRMRRECVVNIWCIVVLLGLKRTLFQSHITWETYHNII
jgi:hypothetical protein